MAADTEEIYSYQYFEYLKNRSKFRKLIRQYYLRDISKYCKGKCIDFGCGIGELLKMLPPGSVGFEVNQEVVNFCKSTGLAVEKYDPGADDYQFKMVDPGKFTTFTMNHVLEHLDNSSEVINKIFASCSNLGISRIIFTVPGIKGFQWDKTHLTYIDLDYLKKTGIFENKYYRLRVHKYFPVNSKTFSKYFTHNELRLVFDKI